MSVSDEFSTVSGAGHVRHENPPKPRPFDRFLNPCDSPRDVPRAFNGPKAGESNEGRMGTSGNPLLAG